MSCVRDCSNCLIKRYTNTPASIVIGLGSARAMCLTRKLSFLRKMCSEDHNEAVSSRTLASLSDDLDSICLIRECRDLDNYFLSDFTSVILQREADTCPIQPVINEEILSKDRKLRLAKHEGRPDLSVVVEVEEAIGWPKLWDLALDRGPNCIHGLRNFVRIVTYPPHATSPCPLCEDMDVPRVWKGIPVKNLEKCPGFCPGICPGICPGKCQGKRERGWGDGRDLGVAWV